MISAIDVLTLLGFAALAWFWADSLRCKEIARAAGLRACQQAGTQFLDDTVALSSLRLRRDARGHVVLYREYRFEFTRNRDYRLRGEIDDVLAQSRAADVMGIDADEARRLWRGFLAREPRGRRVTREAYAHLGRPAPAGAAGQGALFE